MTRVVNPATWAIADAPTLPLIFTLYERKFRLRWHKGKLLYTGPNLQEVGRVLPAIARTKDASSQWKKSHSLNAFRDAKEVTRELVLLTGSHHYLAFWIEGKDGQELRQFPFVYILDEKRFLPRKDAFLQPPDALPFLARWNANCIQCHSVAGRPEQKEGYDERTGKFWSKYNSQVAEQGISCEACHGPGLQHARLYANPLKRREARAQSTSAAIFVPRPQEGERGSEACGQCHSYFLPKDPEIWWTSGFSESFSAGETLDKSRLLLGADSFSKQGSEELSPLFSAQKSSIFWQDGSMIVGGREYNGLRESPCFKEGVGLRKMSCTSCHSLHKGDPNDQLKPQLSKNELCTQCHKEIKETHSLHEPATTGSYCIQCHMPRTSYALLQGISSHQISSPRAQFTSPPNACALCHIDKSQEWITTQLVSYRAATPRDFSKTVAKNTGTSSVALERSLSGNAVERAIYAYSFGTQEVYETVGAALPQQILHRMLSDPYAAIRLISKRSLKELTSISQQRPPLSLKNASDDSLDLSSQTLDRLMEKRDNTPIVVSE